MPIRGFPDRGIVACFNEPNQSGSIDDWNAPRNAPIRDPLNNLQNVIWHSEFFQYELLVPVQTITVTHQALPTKEVRVGASVGAWPTGASLLVQGDMVSRNIILYTHNLGYTPLAFVLVDGITVVSGTRIQYNVNGIQRDISSYADNNVIGIRELVICGSQSAPSLTKNYQVMVFREPIPDYNEPLFGKNNDGIVSLANNKVRTDRQYVRQIEGSESGFVIDLAPTVDIRNGRTRIISGGNVQTDPEYSGDFLGPRFTRIGL